MRTVYAFGGAGDDVALLTVSPVSRGRRYVVEAIGLTSGAPVVVDLCGVSAADVLATVPLSTVGPSPLGYPLPLEWADAPRLGYSVAGGTLTGRVWLSVRLVD